LGRTGRDDERDVQFFEPREQEGQVTKGCCVRPVRIVDDHAERAVCGEVRAQPVEAVEDRERGVDARKGRTVRRCAWEPEQTGCHAGSVLHQIDTFELRCLDERGLEQLPHHAEGEIDLHLGRARPQDAHSALCRCSARRGEQRRLADPGRPFDHHEPAAPRASVGQRRLDPRQLIVPLEERFGGRGHFHVRPAYSPSLRRKVRGSPRSTGASSSPARTAASGASRSSSPARAEHN